MFLLGNNYKQMNIVYIIIPHFIITLYFLQHFYLLKLYDHELFSNILKINWARSYTVQYSYVRILPVAFS